MSSPSRPMIGTSRRRLETNWFSHRAIFAAHAATVVETCSSTSGNAKPSDAPTSIAYVISLDTQTAMYRGLLGDRRMLIVLDNARDAGQVQPLLPGAGNSAVLVTSRTRLFDLVAREGAHAVTVRPLPSLKRSGVSSSSRRRASPGSPATTREPRSRASSSANETAPSVACASAASSRLGTSAGRPRSG